VHTQYGGSRARYPSLFEQSSTQSAHDGFGARSCVEFAEDGIDVELCSVLRNMQARAICLLLENLTPREMETLEMLAEGLRRPPGSSVYWLPPE